MSKTRRIHNWILLPLTLIVLCGLLVMLARTAMENSRLEEAKEAVHLTMHDQAAAFQSALEWRYGVLSILAEKIGENANVASYATGSTLEHFAESSPFESVAAIGADLKGYDSLGGVLDVSDRRYARLCLSGERTVEYFTESAADNEPHFVAAVPMIRDGRVVGLAAGSFKRDAFYESLDLGYDVPKGYYLVCDPAGDVLAFSDNLPVGLTEGDFYGAIEQEDPELGDAVQDLLEDLKTKDEGASKYTFDGQVWYAFYMPIEVNDWVLISVLPSDAITSEIDPVTQRLIMFLLAFLLAVLFVTAYSGFHFRADLRRNEAEQAAELERLEEEARVDPVTGLRRSAAGCEEVAALLSREGSDATTSVLFLVEISGLHLIFEEVGYEAGNRVLADAAAVIKKMFQQTDVLCYLGSSQLLIFTRGLHRAEFVAMQAAELCAQLQMIRIYDGRSYSVSGVVGISVSQADTRATFEEMLGEATIALGGVRHKKQGFALYQPPEGGDGSAAMELHRFTTAYSFSVRLGAILEEMSSGLILMDVGEKLRPLYVSPSYYRQNGALSEECMSADALELGRHIDENDLPLFRSALQKCVSTQQPQDLVYRMLEDVWHHASLVPFRDEGCGLSMVMLMVTDVSHMQREVLEGKVSQKKMELLLDMSRLISFEVDVPSRTVSVSSSFVENYGWDEAVIRNVPESNIDAGLIHEESVDKFRAMYKSIFKGEAEGQADVMLLNKRDGRFHEMRMSWKMIYDEHSVPVQAVGVAEELFELGASREISSLSELQRRLYVEERYFERAQQYQQTLRRYRHDRKNNIVALRGLLDNGDVEGAKKYLKNMNDVISADAQIITTGNPAVDALLSDKLVKAKGMGIRVEHMVGIAPGSAIDNMDLCLAVGCCLDNAIESCQRSAKMTSEPFIQLKLIEKRGVIVFQMTNTSLVPPAKEKTGALYSSAKEDSLNHGFGLRNLAEIVEKYGGNLDLQQTQEGTFKTSFTLFTGA